MPYIINEKTLALIPYKNNTKILEHNNSFLLNENSSKIVAANCFYYGSSLEGRQKGSSYLIGTNYKPPIIINDKLNIILIPTHSIRNKECIWVNLNNILNYYQTTNNKVMIEFKNHKKVSFSIFDKQVLRATRLESVLRGRNNKKYL